MRSLAPVLPALMSLAISAAEIIPITPAPADGSEPPKAGRVPMTPPPAMAAGMPMARPVMPIEVELVRVAGEQDRDGLARWAELAAQGYRLVQVQTQGSASLLFLERMSYPRSSSGPLRLPQAVEADPAFAQALRTRVQALTPVNPQPPMGPLAPPQR